jgi:hypothetical protein
MRVAHVRIIALLLGMGLLTVTPSWAAEINVLLGTGGCGQLTQGTSGSYTCNPTDPFGPNSSAQSVFTWDASYDAVHMFVSFDATTFDGSVTNGPGAGEVVTINDVLTLDSGTGGGFITFNFDIDGTLEASTYFGSSFLFYTSQGLQDSWTECGPQASSNVSTCTTKSLQANQTVSVTLPYTDDVPLTLYWQFQASIGTGFMAAHSHADGEINFSNTVTLLPLVITDINGNQISPLSFHADSDTAYRIDQPGRVPEPSMTLLVGAGLLAGVGRLRRSARRP